MAQRPDCYGTMFPDLSRVDYNKPLSAKVFEVLVEGHGIGVSSGQITVRPDGWAECTARENCLPRLLRAEHGQTGAGDGAVGPHVRNEP